MPFDSTGFQGDSGMLGGRAAWDLPPSNGFTNGNRLAVVLGLASLPVSAFAFYIVWHALQALADG